MLTQPAWFLRRLLSGRDPRGALDELAHALIELVARDARHAERIGCWVEKRALCCRNPHPLELVLIEGGDFHLVPPLAGEQEQDARGRVDAVLRAPVEIARRHDYTAQVVV